MKLISTGHGKSAISLALLLMASGGVCDALAFDNPVANPEAVVTNGKARFTVLKPEMIRIEYSDNAKFEDLATFAIVNRYMEEVPAYTVKEDADYLYIATDKLSLRYRKGTNPQTLPASPANLSIDMTVNGRPVKWYPGKPDPLNLLGTTRTLDGSNGDNKMSEMEKGLISRSGWSVIDDSWTAARADGSRSFGLKQDPALNYSWWTERTDPHAMDLYFLGYGHDYKKALYDFTTIAGKIPLPPAYVFGYWYSKYASYSADDYRQIMKDLKDNDIPSDVMILDMDWHWNGDKWSQSEGRGGWTGWSWNTNLIPDPVKLLGDIHDNGFKIGLNLHPADGVNSVESPAYYAAMKEELGDKYDNGGTLAWSMDYPDFANSFFKTIIRDHESEGVDFWWLDWQQYLTSPNTQGLGETFWCNHVFFNDMSVNRPDRRPVIFHRWGGLGSHRYQIGFSGDALINFPTLAFQPYFTATSSNVGYAYWGHDLGGHAFTDENIVNDPELVLRWIQFGVFSPIFRTHATKDDRIERRIWKFPNFSKMREAVKLRYSLFPYIYTMARKTYDTGIGMCRPLYYEYPEVEEAYNYKDEYFFGDDILVAPVVEAAKGGKSVKKIWFPEGKWWSMATSELIEGPSVKTMEFNDDQIPYFVKEGALLPLYNDVKRVTDRPEEMTLTVIAGSDGTSRLYEDDGDNSDYDNVYATTRFDCKSGDTQTEINIGGRVMNGTGKTTLGISRKWTVRVLNAPAPASVSVNNEKLDPSAWKYDAEGKSLEVILPANTPERETRVTIDHSVSGAAAIFDRNPRIQYATDTCMLTAEYGRLQKSVNLRVIDSNGVEFVKEEYPECEGFRKNLSSLPANMYICHIQADDQDNVTKILKK